MTSALGVETVELDELTVTVVVDNATDTLSSIAPGAPQLPEMVFLLDGASIGNYDGHDMVVTLDHLCVACHGFSALATARPGDRSATALFDVGPYGDVWLANAERLAVDLASIDVLFVSHWHWDHTGAIPTVVAAITEARTAAGLPPLLVDVHPDRPDQRGLLTALGKFAMLPEEPTFAAIEAAGGQIARHADAHPVTGGLFLASGDIPRTTSYETGLRDTTPGVAAGALQTRRSTTSASSRPASAAGAPRSSPPARTRASSTSASRRAAPPGHARRPAAGWLPPRRRQRRAPHRPDREGSRRPRPAAVRGARSLHRLARGDRPRGRLRARPATRRAWWGPGTCSLRPDVRGQE